MTRKWEEEAGNEGVERKRLVLTETMQEVCVCFNIHTHTSSKLVFVERVRVLLDSPYSQQVI